jgi:hypothetical protein
MDFEPQDQVMIDLASDLLKQTEEEKVSWSPTDDADQYIFSATSSSVLIKSTVDHDGDRHVDLSLVNRNGSEVASLGTQFNREEPGGPWTGGPNNKLLGRLYLAARNSALSVSDTLKDIYNAIGIEKTNGQS